MIIHTAEFIGSFNKLSQLPTKDLPEFCFIGRSNVGKSTLINYLTNHNKLAKVSGTPGKTQSLNYFLINSNWHLVDLPGYGYAKRSKKLRAEWERTMYSYFKVREALMCVFLLVDSRVKPMEIDLKMIQWFGENGIPFSIVFTKRDQREIKQCNYNIEALKEKLSESWEELPEHFITSSTERMGGDEVLNYIEKFI